MKRLLVMVVVSEGAGKLVMVVEEADGVVEHPAGLRVVEIVAIHRREQEMQDPLPFAVTEAVTAT